MILLIVAIATFWIDHRVRQLESKTELLLDYDVPLDGVPVLDIRDNGDDYGYALIPFILKITNNSTNRKLSIEKMQASLLFPRDPQQLAVLEQAIVFLDNQPPFPIYLDTGEQQFIHCAIAWPVRREALSRFAEDNRDNLNSLTVSDYLQVFPDDFMQPRLIVKIITPDNLARDFIFNFREYIEGYEVKEFYRWNQQ